MRGELDSEQRFISASLGGKRENFVTLLRDLPYSLLLRQAYGTMT